MTMPFMDKLHTQSPFVVSRMIKTLLNEMGMKIGRTNIRILMRRMVIQELAPQPGTSKAAPGNLTTSLRALNSKSTTSFSILGS